MAELTGVFKNALAFSQQYIHIINNGVATSFRTPLSGVCEDIIRIYDIDACDYMKHFQLENGVTLIFLFTKSEDDCYRTIKFANCIFVVVPVTELFKTLGNDVIMQGILDALYIILNFANVLKYGSPCDIYKSIFAAFYFMSYTFCSCYELDDVVRQSLEKVMNDSFGDVVKAEHVIKALTSVREERFEENTVDLFANHRVLKYMDSESLDSLISAD